MSLRPPVRLTRTPALKLLVLNALTLSDSFFRITRLRHDMPYSGA